MSDEKQTEVVEKQITADVVVDGFNEKIEAAVAKAMEVVASRQKAFNLTDSANNEAKLEAAKEAFGVAKMFKAMASGDSAYKAQHNAYHAKFLKEGTDSAGGYLVPDEFSRELLRLNQDYSVIRQDSRKIAMSSDVYRLNSLSTKPSVFLNGEATSISGTTMVFGEPVLTAKKYATILPWTTEFQEDEEVGILPVIASEIAEAMALAENTEFISGATAGSLGILAVTGVTAHSLISGASFSNLTWDDLNTMIAKLANISASESMTAKFYFSPDVFMALTRTKAAGDGNYFVGYAPNGDTIYRAWGREVRIVNGMPALAASAGTTKFGFLADLSRHAFIGDRRGMTMDLLTEGTVKDSAGNDVNLAQTDSKALRVTKRTAFVTALQTGIVTVATN